MKLTIGKVVWFFSFILFLGISYNQNAFERLWDIFFKSSAIVYIQEFSMSSSDTTSLSISESDTSNVKLYERFRVSQAFNELEESLESYSEESESNEEITNDVYLEVEKIKWEIQQIKEDFDEIKIKIEKEVENKDKMFDNLLAFITAISPLLVPIVTARYTNHKKEINLRKKS